MKEIEGYYSESEIKKREERGARWGKWIKYQNWQAAMTMNNLFGKGYVEVPPIPEGYEEIAQAWWNNKTH